MKTTQKWRDAERQRIVHLEIGSSVRIGDRTLIALLDDADELARLREGLNDNAATWKGAVSAMQERIDRTDRKYEEHLGYRHALEDCADEIQALLNGDGDG